MSVLDPQDFATYQLLIDVPIGLQLQVGALGCRDVPAGYFIYTGSAKRHLAARLRRHLCREKRPHWHIDYLLRSSAVAVIATRVTALTECQANRLVTGTIEIPRFGASDCRAGCGSHLKRVEPAHVGDGWAHHVPRGAAPRM